MERFHSGEVLVSSYCVVEVVDVARTLHFNTNF